MKTKGVIILHYVRPILWDEIGWIVMTHYFSKGTEVKYFKNSLNFYIGI